MGASLLALFLNLKMNLGFGTIVIAHVMFCISFVVVTVKARIASLDPRLEQAAMDLYADEMQTFRRVTLPLVAPGILGRGAAGVLAVFDDFIITNFDSGYGQTPSPSSSSSPRCAASPLRRTSSRRPCSSSRFAVLVAQLVSRRRKARSLTVVTTPAVAARGSPRRRRTTPFWLDRPARPSRAPAPGRRPRRATWPVVGGGYTGLWTALLAKERDPGRDVCCSRRTVGWAASGRNGGFCAAEPDPRPAQRAGTASPTRSASSSGSGTENLDGIGRPSRRTASTARSSGPASSTSPPRPGRLDELPELPAAAGGSAREVEWLDADAGAGPGRLATYLGGLLDRDGVRHGRPGPAGLGPARAACGSASGSTSTRPVRALDAHGAGVGVAHADGRVDGAPGGARHQRVPASAAPRSGPTWCRSGTTR